MRILVLGKNGQLGQSINKLINIEFKSKYNPNFNEFVFVGREELDLNNKNSIDNYFNNNDKFDIIINCAAYTAVDKAEQEQEIANQVNHLAVEQLARIANQQKSKLIHVSTDYVFNGENNSPYIESDKAIPINIYGKTKLDGELAIQKQMSENAIIIRVSWLYSEFGGNFVNTMLNIGRKRDKISVISNQIGSPTYAIDLTKALMRIIVSDKFVKDFNSEVYHYCSLGSCSWYDFAKSIFKYKDINCKVVPIHDKDWPHDAKRPKYSALSNNKIQKKFNLKIKDWKLSMHTCLDKM